MNGCALQDRLRKELRFGFKMDTTPRMRIEPRYARPGDSNEIRGLTRSDAPLDRDDCSALVLCSRGTRRPRDPAPLPRGSAPGLEQGRRVGVIGREPFGLYAN